MSKVYRGRSGYQEVSLPLLQFHAQQLERHGRSAQEAQELQQFHRNQMAARQDQKEAERKEEVKFNLDNVHLLQVQSVWSGVLCTGVGRLL